MSSDTIFPSYEQQLASARRWMDRRISLFGPSHVEQVHSLIPQLPPPTLEPLQATFLIPQFGVYARTIEMLWGAVREAHLHIASEYGRNLELLQLADDEVASCDTPSLRWVQIQLDANVGLPLLRSPSSGLHSEQHQPLAGIELLAAAAHAPRWAQQLGQRFPSVALGQCRWQTTDGAFSVPRLSCINSSILCLLRATNLIGAGKVAQPTIKVLGP